MKNEFIGFYNATEKEINDAWTKGVFAFDANALLNLYRYTETTRNDFIEALKTIKDKLFLPYQAAYEYHSNRLSVIEGLEQSYSNFVDNILPETEKKFQESINQYKKHPSIELSTIFKLHSEFITKVKKELESQKKNHPNFHDFDKVLDELTKLFENHIGKKFSKDELNEIFLEGKERYTEQIPPGYKDLERKRNRGDKHIYGDLIIWKELINYSSMEKRQLIFITDDRKEDWWTVENGKTIRPREELIKEFFDQTGIRILIYNADTFLHYAEKKKLIPQLKEETLKEVKETRIKDENYIWATFNGFTQGGSMPNYFANQLAALSDFSAPKPIPNYFANQLAALSDFSAPKPIPNYFANQLAALSDFSTKGQSLSSNLAEQIAAIREFSTENPISNHLATLTNYTESSISPNMFKDSKDTLSSITNLEKLALPDNSVRSDNGKEPSKEGSK